MSNPILIGTDFSASSQPAFTLAKQLARKLTCPLHIAHTFIPPFVDPNTPVSIVDALHEQNQAIFKGKLDEWVTEAQSEGIEAKAHLIFSDVPTGLSEKAEEIGAQLVIIGKTGEGGLLNWLIGSNAVSLLNTSKTPLLMVPGAYQPQAVHRLVYATQLEYDETEILKQVKSLQGALEASIHFIKLDVEGQPNIQPDYGYEKTIELLFDQPVSHVIADHVVEGLHQQVQQLQGQILITASHHRNFITQLIEPSITKKIINVSEVPVLVYRFQESNI